jgi:hypothetical protein
MAVDAQQHLWVGTDGGGVAMFDGFVWTRFTNAGTSGGLLSDTVYSVNLINGSMWFGGPNGVSLYNPSTQQWGHYTTAEGLPTNEIRVVTTSSHGIAAVGLHYFGTGGNGVVICNLVVIQGQPIDCSQSETQGNGKLPNDFIVDMAVVGSERWIVTGNGVVHVHTPSFPPGGAEVRTTYLSGTAGCEAINEANSMTLDYAHHRIWFALSSRVFAVGDPGPGVGACVFDTDTETWRTFTTANSGLGDNSAVSIAIDREGRAWFGTLGSEKPGVYVYTWISETCCWQSYRTDTPGAQLSENFVRSVYASLDRVWFGHLNSLSSFALNWQSFSRNVSALASLPGQLWVGTPTELLTFNGTTFTTVRPNVNVQDILALNANQVWVATDSGLLRWSGNNWRQFTTSNSGIASNNLTSVARDNLGRIWAGTAANGVSVFNGPGNNWATFDASNVLPSNNVHDVAANAAGDVWVASAGGLSHFDGSTWTTFTMANGLPANDVRAVAMDAGGIVWAGTAAGAASWDGTAWTNRASAMPADEVLAIHAPATGGVWFGVVGGALFYDDIRWDYYRASNSGLTHERIRALTSDSTGAVWFGGLPYVDSANVPGGLFVRSVDPEPLGNEIPAITSFTPVSGPAGTNVTITGSGFQPGSKVFFGGVLANVLSLTGTSIVVELPSQAIKSKLRVTNATGSATSTNEFSPIPVITAIDPASGPIGLPIKIMGTNLASVGFSEAKFGASAYSSLIISSTSHNLIEAVVPADASNGAVMVKTTGGEATGPSFTLTSGGLKLLDWEVHQGLPQYDHLVAGKSTVVRLFLGSDAPGGCAYVTGVLLQLLGPGGSHINYAQTQSTGGIPNGGWFCGTTKQVAAGGSVDFVIPGDQLPHGMTNLAVSFSSRFVTLFSKVLGNYPFSSTDDLRVQIAAPAWDHWDDQSVYGSMTAQQVGSFSFNRQLVNFPRIYPVRDGAGGIFSENGLRWVMNPNFTLCNGVDDGFCSHASDSYNFLYDFWQESLSGGLRYCMVQTRFPSNTTDDGSVMHFKSSFNPNDLKRFDFIVLVRPGVTLPADLKTLVSFNTGSPDLVVESQEIVKTLQGPAGTSCPSMTYTDMFLIRTRIRNTGGSTFTNQPILADYDETKVNSAANGGMVLGTGATPQTYIQPGQFFLIDGAQGDMFDPPMDINYNGMIDADDLAHFVAEFDDWNPATGDFTTSQNFNLITPKDVLRNFIDENGNQAADPSDTWAPSLERHRDQYVRYAIYDVPRAYRDAFNANSPVDAQFSQVWLWNRANPFGFMGLGGQTVNDVSMWATMDASSAIVHETGHSTGLPHSAESGDPSLPFGNIPNIPYGYNTVEHRVVLGVDLRSVMAGSVVSPIENVFFNPLQYHHVYDLFRSQFSEGAARAASASATPVIHLSGSISRAGEVTLHASYRSSELPPTPIDVAGDYWLRLVGSGGVLAEYRFGVDFDVQDLPEGELQPDHASFAVTQPWAAGTKSVEIWDSSHPLYRLIVSASAPTVAVQSLNSGENVAANGTLTVKWSGSDADGDLLSYDVYYSADGGITWLTLAAATHATQIAVPAADLPGSNNALVEVRVSDGVNVGSDRSNANFSVAGKGPLWANIVAPNFGEQVLQSQLQTLVGTGYDLEDGEITGSHLSWFSDQLGALGSGESLTVTLPAGVHRLTLVATDSANLTTSSSITVEVLADFDGDGLSDAYEAQHGALAWWNPDDAGQDPDNDGLTSRSEAAWGTDPSNPDSDGDGVKDGDEAVAGSLPTDANSKPQAARVMASEGKLSFAMAAGGANPASVQLLVMSSTPTNIGWSASVTGAWLKVDGASGQTPDEVTVSVNGAGLAVGVYQGEINFTGGASPWTIPVTLTVADPAGPSLQLHLPTISR